MLTPRIETVIQETNGKFDLAKVSKKQMKYVLTSGRMEILLRWLMFSNRLQVDIDEHSDLALDYDVSSVPVLVVMQDGKEVKRLVGLQDADKLRNWVLNSVK